MPIGCIANHHLVMPTDNALLDQIHTLDTEMETLIGRKVFGHIAAPTKTSLRITFGDGYVCLTMAEAHDYMHGLVKQARQDPSKLPWPLCEPVPSA